MFGQRSMRTNSLDEAPGLHKICIINWLDVNDPMWFWYRWWFRGKTTGAKAEL